MMERTLCGEQGVFGRGFRWDEGGSGLPKGRRPTLSSFPRVTLFVGRGAHHIFPVKGVPDPLSGEVISVVAVSLGDDFSSTGVRFRTDN